MNKIINKNVSVFSALVLSVVCLAVFPVNLSGNSVGGAEMDMETAAEMMAARFNEERAKLGLYPLYMVPYLNDVADIRAHDVVTCWSEDHKRPDGTKVDSLIDTDIVDYSRMFEILARGSFDIDAVMDAWKNSSAHWASITDKNATHMGISVVYDPDSERKWYWAAVIVNMEEGMTLPEQKMPLADAVVPTYCGDVDGDGQIDSFDLVLLNKYINNKVYFNEAQVAAADIFADGAITQADADFLRKYILGKYDKLPITIDMLVD